MVAYGEVKAYIFTAIGNIKRKYEDQLSDNQYNELEDVEVSISKPDLEKLTYGIVRAEVVFLELGLYPK